MHNGVHKNIVGNVSLTDCMLDGATKPHRRKQSLGKGLVWHTLVHFFLLFSFVNVLLNWHLT